MSDNVTNEESPLGHWGVMMLAANPPDTLGEMAVRIGKQSHRYTVHSSTPLSVGIEVKIVEMHSDGSVTVETSGS